MKKNFTRLFSLLLAVLMFAGCFMFPTSANSFFADENGIPSPNLGDPDNGNKQADLSGALSMKVEHVYNSEDIVPVIVRLEGESLLERAIAKGMNVADYVMSEEGKAQLAAMQQAQEQAIAQFGDKLVSVGYRYTTLFSGFSCQVKFKELAGIESAGVVRKAMIAERYETQSVVTDNALNAYGTGIYNSSQTGYTGKGIVVAVLDTGLDYTHSAFQRLPDCPPTLTKERVQELFPYLEASKLDENAVWESTYHTDKLPFGFDYADKDADYYPSNDHGTHVAGIIAGKDDVITGVAVDAQLLTMKVFGNEDKGAKQEDILAGLSDAVMFGVDVINMSLGSTCGFSRAADDEGINEVYDSVREAGINLIVAASNNASSAKGSENGDTNLLGNPDSATIGSPATYPSSMAVASVTGAKTNYLFANGEFPVYLIKAKRSNGDEIEFYDLMLDGAQTKTLEYVLVPGIGNDGNYEQVDVKGKIAVIKRGVSTFEEKVETAKNHGALGAIIYNNVSGTITMTIGMSTLPATSISMDSGKYFESHPTGTLVLDKDNLAGPFISDFSSWGPNPNLELSPDVTSYGGDINSAVRGGYDILSGTSMASPNLAGSAALVRQVVKEKYPELTSRETMIMVNRLLMSTASILRNEANNPYSPRKQGAGLADAERAIKTPAYLLVQGSDKSKISLGHDPQKTGAYTMTFDLVNMVSAAQSYQLAAIVMTESVSTDEKTVAEQAYILSPAVTYAVQNGYINGSMVTVPGYGTTTITVTVTLSEADRAYLDKTFKNGMYVEGYVTLDAQDSEYDLTLPYLGFYGDWTKAPLLDVTAFEVGEEKKNPAILEDEKLKPDVFATLPMAGYYNGSGRTEDDYSYYYMARPAYILADGYEEPATLEKYCSLTSSKSGNFKLEMIAAGLLRNAKTIYMTITDSVTGEVIFERTTQNGRKSYYSGAQTGGYVLVEFDASTANLANNRKYDFLMTCELEWEGEQNNEKNTFAFSFYMDEEAPVICQDQNTLRVKTDKAGNITEYLYDMYIYDNQYIQGYFLYTYDYLDENGNPVNAETLFRGMVPVDDFEAGKVNKITHDLTDLWYRLKDGEQEGSKNIGIQVIDYAKHNTSLYYTITYTDATKVDFKNGRQTTANGDAITFNMKPYQQRNLLENLETQPKDVYTTPVSWVSSDPTIADVENGIVTTKKEGTVTITATSATGATSFVTIVVSGAPASDKITVSSLKLNETAVVLERGETLELYVDVLPHNVDEMPELEWSTVSRYVTLTVDPEDPTHCTVYAKDSGRANITVKVKGKLFSATCRVNVKQEFEIESVYLNRYNGRGDENGVVTIPAEKGIMYIKRLAFMNNKHIKKVIIPEGVEVIEYAAFYNCENLEEIVLPSTCTEIQEWGFGHNKKLQRINLENVQTIFRYVFYGCTSLEAVDLSKCNTICDYAFAFCSSIEELDVSMVGQLGEFSFIQCTSLKSLKLSDNMIPQYCFAYCTSLQSLEIGSGFVGRLAFVGCSRLTELTFKNDVTEIGYAAFNSCSSLAKLNFEGEVKYIGAYAFGSCVSLPSVYIPAGCRSLGDFAFAGCSDIESITVSRDARLDEIGMIPFYSALRCPAFSIEPGSKYLTVYDGALYTADMTKLVLYPYGRLPNQKTVQIPNSVTEIGDYAFAGHRGVELVYLNYVEKIGTGAFLESVVKGVAHYYVTEIGDSAFSGCANLQIFMTQTQGGATELPRKIEKIGEHAFANSNKIAWGETLTIPATVKEIGKYAFAANNIKKAVVPADLAVLSEGVFALCENMTEVVLKNGLTEIGAYAFRGCKSLTSIAIPSSVTTLGDACFAECTEITSLMIPNKVTEIPKLAFYGMEKLQTVLLSDSVVKVSDYAFAGTPALASVNLKKVEEIGDYAFYTAGVTTLQAPEVKTIGDYAFAGTKLQSLVLPELVNAGVYAFSTTTKLDSFNAPKLEVLGEGAFFRSSAITSLDLPCVKEVGDAAFYRAEKLTSVSMPSLEKLGTMAFYFTGVDTVALPATLTELAPGALLTKPSDSSNANIARIENVTLDANCADYFIDEVGAIYRRLADGKLELVSYASGIQNESYTILDGTVRIEEQAFATNVYLKEVTVARTVTNIGSSAFFGCSSLEKINFLSVEAPMLESKYYQASPDGWTYDNFVTTIPTVGQAPVTLTVTVPKNAVRYDNYMWQRYIGEATRTDVIAMTNSTEYLIRMIEALPETVTLADAEQVDFLNRVYDSCDAGQKAFVTNYQKLKAATDRIAALRAQGGTQNGLQQIAPNGEMVLEDLSGGVGAVVNSAAPEGMTEQPASNRGVYIICGVSLLMLLSVVAAWFACKKQKGGN